jgi:phage FluMu protein Com
VPNYDPELPIGFHCPHCKKNHQLRGGEAEKQTPPEFLPTFLSFKCPGCQTMLKSRVEQGHWVKDMSGRKSVYVLDRTGFA